MKSKDKKIENLAEARYLCKASKPSKPFDNINNNIQRPNNTNINKYINFKYINIIMIVLIYLFEHNTF